MSALICIKPRVPLLVRRRLQQRARAQVQQAAPEVWPAILTVDDLVRRWRIQSTTQEGARKAVYRRVEAWGVKCSGDGRERRFLLVEVERAEHREMGRK
jgi:hypothetical protein